MACKVFSSRITILFLKKGGSKSTWGAGTNLIRAFAINIILNHMLFRVRIKPPYFLSIENTIDSKPGKIQFCHSDLA